MSDLEMRRVYAVSEELVWEGGRAVGRPVKRVAVAAVIANPLAGQIVDDLDLLIGFGEELGDLLTRRAIALLEGEPAESFGKAAIVGLAGELEHAAALLHPKFGAPMRAALGGGAAIIPSAKKMAVLAMRSMCRSITRMRRSSAATSTRSRCACLRRRVMMRSW